MVKVTVTLEHRPPSTRNEFMRTGRFGGGWDWSVGVQVGRRAIVFNLLIATLAIRWTGRTEGS